MQSPYYPAGPYIPYGAPAYNSYIPQPIAPTDKKAREALLTTLANQIDYYFSAENLLKDIYLRKNMNDHGFLPLSVISSFHRVVGLTYGQIVLILECLPKCKNLEYGTIEEFDETKFRTLDSKDDCTLPFQTYKFRAAEDPLKWVLPEDQRLKHGKDQSIPAVTKRYQEPEAAKEEEKVNGTATEEKKTVEDPKAEVAPAAAEKPNTTEEVKAEN
ncbi:unnamed protein product [Ambrosiozyma monospora]|uniref:Unnamed protein product n=1 Tax=Ambrosiozyma monospora TaxID=43982 RepID=A0ACB5SUT2_AMBMO|nr:unnamed protein product [Ambrosiozyma monospora]